MEPFRHHVFVCTQSKPEGVTSCCSNGSLQVLRALEHEVAAQGLDDEVQVTTCGCLGLCDDGPLMIVYPDGVWYRNVKEPDVPEIVNSHLRDAKVVSRLEWKDSATMKAAATEHRDRYRATMKAKDESGILPDDLNETIRGFMPSRAILTALELDVFSAVGQGGSAEDVARKIYADARATEMLLNVLVSLRLLEKEAGIYRTTHVSARFFSPESRDNARPALIHTANLWHRWSTLTECVQAGTSVERRHQEGNWVTSFIAAMDRNAKERAAAIVKAAGTDGIRRMLDLGGGSGAYSIAFARATPGLKSEILDQRDVVALAKDYIREAGFTDRITTRIGDMLSDPLGDNYDLILLSAICHMFSPDENRRLFRRIYEALAPNGRVVVQDFILEPTRTAPRFATLFSLNMLVGTRAGSSYSEPEYESWLHGAGFSDVYRVRVPGPAGVMIGVRV